MKPIQLFAPAISSSSVYGSKVEQQLVLLSLNVGWAKQQGVQIQRDSRATAAANDQCLRGVQRPVEEALLMILVDGSMAPTGLCPHVAPRQECTVNNNKDLHEYF